MRRRITLFASSFLGYSTLLALDKLKIYPKIVIFDESLLRRKDSENFTCLSDKFEIIKVSSESFTGCKEAIGAFDSAIAVGWTKDFFHGFTDELNIYHVHPSLLPMYRGYSSVSEQFLRGVVISGLSIYRDDGKIDAGPIVYQEKIRIELLDTPELLLTKCAFLTADFIKRVTEGESIIEHPQDESKAFYIPRIRNKLLLIDFNASAIAIHNFIRAYSYPYPYVIFYYKGRRYRVAKSSIESWSGIEGQAGELVSKKSEGLEIACGEGSILLNLILDDNGKEVRLPIEKGELLG